MQCGVFFLTDELEKWNITGTCLLESWYPNYVYKIDTLSQCFRSVFMKSGSGPTFLAETDPYLGFLSFHDKKLEKMYLVQLKIFYI
jgi:hypothetical protein